MSQIQKKLDLIAKHVNELSDVLKKEYGRETHIYFESEGDIPAISGSVDGGSSRERQTRIIASARHARFDCGAW